ncbi:MAG TPA: type II secretion system protein [Candidatus Saccharimonadales bacterium]|nr:type II secretion system protein [Candidatus Saccharimonadales bacterium]
MIHKKAGERVGRSAGFTIIEVLIVLAIAGLILLVVFLAVPAVQRSQRNQSRKADVKSLLAATSEFTSNNGGIPPASQANITTVTSNMKLGYFKAVNIFYGTTPGSTVSASSTTPAADVNSAEELNVYVGYTCTSATTAASQGNTKNVAVEYVLEQASGNGILQCVSS